MGAADVRGGLGKFKTPTLVIAGERDYRVPYTQSLEFFSALQRQGVPSKLVVFPDEGHWMSEAAERAVLVQDVFGLAGDVLEVGQRGKALRRRASAAKRAARNRKRWKSKKARSATSTTTMTMVAMG